MAGNQNPARVAVLTPQVASLDLSGNKNIRRRKEQSLMIRTYENMNSYLLVLTYVPSDRPRAGLREEELNGEDGFSIHSIWPAHQYLDQEGKIVARGIKTSNVFDMDLPVPTVDPALEGRLRREWRGLGNGARDVLQTQAEKHLKYHDLEPPKEIFETGYTHGIDFTTPEGRYYLMERIERAGYEAGKVYNCGIFVKDIGEELGFGVKATFSDHPNGRRSKVLRLREILVLYDHAAEEIIEGEKAQPFDEDSVFMLEDLRIRKILGN